MSIFFRASEFEIPDTPRPGVKHAHLCVSYDLLREILRLPPNVIISAIRPDPSNGHAGFIDIYGYDLPAEGELTANYTYQHHTSVTFTGFTKP